jgi:hypothetical protein
MKRIFWIGILLYSFIMGWGQDSMIKEPKWTVSGYVKEMGWLRFDKDLGDINFTNLLHNRVNIKWKPSKSIIGRIDIRNRYYWGKDVEQIPGFKDRLRNNNENFNLSALGFKSKSTIFYSNIERAWLELKKSQWNVRVGRQRINWGITNTWNPNDIFNTYNFLDFDYEERPGSDALNLKYNTNEFSHIELAMAATNNSSIVAAKYFINFKNYDLQWIAGSYKGHFTTGIGWAGSITDVGFKGEAQYFSGKGAVSNLNITIEADYILKNGLYISTAMLYNENGFNEPLTDWSRINFEASPQNLMPAKWNWLINASKEVNPLFSGTLSIIYAPRVNMLILFPTIRYNIITNLDADLVWQSFFSELQSFQAISHTGYLRLKYSF